MRLTVSLLGEFVKSSVSTFELKDLQKLSSRILIDTGFVFILTV